LPELTQRIPAQTVTKLRAADGVNLGTFKVGDGAAGIVFDGTNLWVVCNGDSTVVKVAPSTGEIISTYATGKGPFTVAYDGNKVWVPNSGNNSISSTAAN
jgi:DNA-binding beta-propeller fold protein YncE